MTIILPIIAITFWTFLMYLVLKDYRYMRKTHKN